MKKGCLFVFKFCCMLGMNVLWHFSSGFIIKDLNDFLMLLDACLLFLLNVTLQDGYGERLSIKHGKF